MLFSCVTNVSLSTNRQLMFLSFLSILSSVVAIQAARRPLPRQARAENGGELPTGATNQQSSHHVRWLTQFGYSNHYHN